MAHVPDSPLQGLLTFKRLPAPMLNGLSIGAGMLLNTACVGMLWGPQAGVIAASGFAAMSVADTVCAPQAKWSCMWPALLSGLTVSAVVALTCGHPLAQGIAALVVTFLALLWSAWGKRGLPQSFVMILSLVFQMAAFSGGPLPADALLAHLAWVAQGGLAMVAWSMITCRLLAARYRTLALAQCMNSLSRLILVQARWTVAQASTAPAANTPDAKPLASSAPVTMLAMVAQQAGLADVFQTARDLIYAQAHRTNDPRVQRQVDALIHLVNVRDSAMASQLDIEPLRAQASGARVLRHLAQTLSDIAQTLRELAQQLRQGHAVDPSNLVAQRASSVHEGSHEEPTPPHAHGVKRRAEHLAQECRRLAEVLAGTGASTRLPTPLDSLVSPTSWPLAPARTLLSAHSPTLRYATRGTLAMACALLIAHHLPWASHPHWLLMTVAVVMRGNLEQTLARRDARIAGTLLGCVMASALLWLDVPMPVLLLVLAMAMSTAHGYVLVDYRVTAAAGAVLALTQTHLLAAAQSHMVAPVWQDAAIRVADTLIGAALAWGFSYVLPAWERRQLPPLIQRLRVALLNYSLHALQWHVPGQNTPVKHHARREVYDCLWLLAQSLQRSRKEPLSARAQVLALEELLVHGHRLIGQLAGARLLLQSRQQELADEQTAHQLALTANTLKATLDTGGGSASWPASVTRCHDTTQDDAPWDETQLPSPSADPHHWLWRRLRFIQSEAMSWRQACKQLETDPARPTP
jgi:uncharacterized membrane protein YccC